MANITTAQLRLLHLAPKQLGMDDDAFKMILKDLTGKTSRASLTGREAGRVIDALVNRYGFAIARRPRRQGYRRRAAPRKSGNVVSLASADELDKIEALARLVEWRAEHGFAGWLRSRMGIERVRTAEDAYKVIEGLKKMFEGQQRRKYGEAWWTMDWPQGDIRNYIQAHCPAEYR